MRKLQAVLAAAMVFGIASVATAQDGAPQRQGQGQGRGDMMRAMMQGITLSAEQQVKFDAVTKKYTDARQALMQEEGDQDTRRAKMREAMTKQSDEIKAILTDEQKKIFEANQAEMQARMQGGGRPPQL